MPNRSRLLGYSIILAIGLGYPPAWAMTDLVQKAKPAMSSSSSVSNGIHESIGNDFPVAEQTSETPIPAVVSGAVAMPEPGLTKPAITNTAIVVANPVPVIESKPEKHKLSNDLCDANDNNVFQKSLLVTAFPRLTPTSSNAGDLADAEHQLPQLIGEQLVAKRNTIAPVQLNESLPQTNISNDNLLAQQIQQLARHQRSQLVLSGVIQDMSMAHPEATYNPSLYTRFINGTVDFLGTKNRFEERDRRFSFTLNLRDGYTGQTLFSQSYSTYGIWNQTKNVGFGTPLFWEMDYGKQIKGLIKKAAKEVGAVIQCQPYIAQIDSRPGQTQIILQGGANNGLHAGDMLALYQLVVQGSETLYDQHQVRLVNRNTTIELREVYPSHSIGVISSTAYLTGQFLAVSP